MLLNDSGNRKLFSKVVPVFVPDAFSNQYRERSVLFTIEWKKPTSGVYEPDVLSFSLIDNDDPFFLYNSQLSVDEFDKIKATHSYNIELSSLPSVVIGDLESCLQNDKAPDLGHTICFNAKDPFIDGECILTIEVKGPVRNNKLLYLKFIPANDSAVRQYVTSSFRCLNEEKKKLQNNIAFMERDLKGKLEACRATFTSKVQELEEVIKQMKVEMKEKDNKHQIELQEEIDRYSSRHKDEIYKLEKEFNEKECNLAKEMKQYESRVNILETLNKELDSKNFKNESTIKELNSKLHFLEEDYDSLKRQLLNSKYKCEHLQSEVQERKLCIQRLEEKINELQQDLRGKGQSISKFKEQIESEKELKRSVENDLENIKLRLEMSERTRQDLEEEKEKFNDVIVDLQEQLKELTKEEKNKSHLVTKYKKIIEEKNKALMDVKQKNCDLEIKLQTVNAEVRHLTESIGILQNKIDDLTKDNKNQENVIKYLNRKLTENLTFTEHETPLTTSPSSLAQKQLAKISENLPQLENATAKLGRIDTTSAVCKQSSLTPSQSHKTAGVDSAYHTANQATPEILAGNHKMNFNPSNFKNDLETDQALHAAFANEGGTFKHSTAKKPIRPVKSITPKSSKKK